MRFSPAPTLGAVLSFTVLLFTSCTGSTNPTPTDAIPKDTGTPIRADSVTWSGQTYKTVAIGSQTWMAENLNVPVVGSSCYENREELCATHGRLYSWAAAMGLDSSYNAETWGAALPRQGVCPPGWHVPSDQEWKALRTWIAGRGGEIKSTSGWGDLIQLPYWRGYNGTDIYGFRAIPAGTFAGNSFFQLGYGAYFWSASEDSAHRAWEVGLTAGDHSFTRGSGAKQGRLSLRCLKD
jgi:uncharacterized protein (TIGR02145 family)